MTVSEYTIIQLEDAQHSLNTIHTLINSIYNDPGKLRQDVVNHRLDQIRSVVESIDLSLAQVRQLNTVVSVVHTETLDNNVVLEIHRYGLPVSYKYKYVIFFSGYNGPSVSNLELYEKTEDAIKAGIEHSQTEE